jgi:hypothetical protein
VCNRVVTLVQLRKCFTEKNEAANAASFSVFTPYATVVV